MNPLVSIIVPVYHAGKRLDTCIRSLIEQTCTSLEIILVDDGSTQEDYRNCEKWKQADQRIQVIHRENGGAASARNTGIENAAGKYICFVDADDYAAPDMIARMTEYMEQTRADLVLCDYQDVPDKNHENPVVWENKTCYSGREFLLQGMRSRDLHAEIAMIVPWNKLFRRELLAENLFISGRKHEDLAWHYRVLYAAKKIGYLSDKLYFYVDNSEGTSHSYKEIHPDFLIALGERLSYWKDCGEEELYVLTYELYTAAVLRMSMEVSGWKAFVFRGCSLREQMVGYDTVYRMYRCRYQMNRKNGIKRLIFLRIPLVLYCYGIVKRFRKNKG